MTEIYKKLPVGKIVTGYMGNTFSRLLYTYKMQSLKKNQVLLKKSAGSLNAEIFRQNRFFKRSFIHGKCPCFEVKTIHRAIIAMYATTKKGISNLMF